MGSLRTAEEQERYNQFKAQGGLSERCPLCNKEAIHSFDSWIITPARFTFDKVAKVHHLLLPKRHVAEPGLSEEEKTEFERIKEEYLHKEYEYLIEATHQKKSIPDHF